MNSFSIAIKLCSRSVLCTAIVFASQTIFHNPIGAFWGTGAILIGGPFVALPLFAVTIPLVSWSATLPYNNQARIAWVILWLAAVIIGVVAFFMEFAPYKPFPWDGIGATIAGIILAVYFTRRSFSNYYIKKYETR